MKFVSLAAALVALVEAVDVEYGYGGFAPTYYGGNNYGYNRYGGHGHSHSHSHDDDDDDVDKSTWYNKYQQYSNPKIAYKPTTRSKTTYATCDFTGTDRIQLAQMPGKAVMARINLQDLPDTADTYAIRVQECATTGAGCDNLGDEYNPLTEKDKLGRANPYQDPSRGRFENISVTGVDPDRDVTDLIQKDILLNILGPNSIMGRSIALYSVDGAGVLSASPISCCVIGYDAAPELADDVKSTHHHHHSSYGYRPKPTYRPSYGSYRPSYGGYGGHGKSFW